MLLAIIGVLFALLVLLVLVGVGFFNRLITLRNRYQNAFSQIDVQLTRRYDLIPNLVETAKAYMQHEREALEAVIAARNQAQSGFRRLAQSPDDPAAMQTFAMAEQGLGGVLGRFFALSEAYPDLKASDNMKQLSEELSSTENRVAFSRQAYNDGVTEFNIVREKFPSNIVAALFSFKPAVLLEVEDITKRQAPLISFS